MYLEGAVQNEWSVPDMRQQRWEATGGPAELRPREADLQATEWDEDAAEGDDGLTPATISESFGEVHDASGPADKADGVIKVPAAPPMPGRRRPTPRLRYRRPATRWCGPSRPCRRCRRTWPRRSTSSSWRSSTTRSPAGRKSPGRTSWRFSTRSGNWRWPRRNNAGATDGVPSGTTVGLARPCFRHYCVSQRRTGRICDGSVAPFATTQSDFFATPLPLQIRLEVR